MKAKFDVLNENLLKIFTLVEELLKAPLLTAVSSDVIALEALTTKYFVVRLFHCTPSC